MCFGCFAEYLITIYWITKALINTQAIPEYKTTYILLELGIHNVLMETNRIQHEECKVLMRTSLLHAFMSLENKMFFKRNFANPSDAIYGE